MHCRFEKKNKEIEYLVIPQTLSIVIQSLTKKKFSAYGVDIRNMLAGSEDGNIVFLV